MKQQLITALRRYEMRERLTAFATQKQAPRVILRTESKALCALAHGTARLDRNPVFQGVCMITSITIFVIDRTLSESGFVPNLSPIETRH